MPHEGRSKRRINPPFRKVHYTTMQEVEGKVRQQVNGHRKQADKQPQPPPNYRLAVGQVSRCASCKHFQAVTGQCDKFQTPVDGNYVCDAWEGQQLHMPKLKSPKFGLGNVSPDADDELKMAAATRALYKISAFDMTGGTGLGPDSGMGSPVASGNKLAPAPTQNRNPFRAVKPVTARPLVNPDNMGQLLPGPTPVTADNGLAQAAPAPGGSKIASCALFKRAFTLSPAGQQQQQAQQQPPQQPPPGQPAPAVPAPAPAPAQPGQFKPSPIASTMLSNPNDVPVAWQMAAHDKMVPQAPPMDPAQQVSTGAQAKAGQQLQKTGRQWQKRALEMKQNRQEEKDLSSLAALIVLGLTPYQQTILKQARGNCGSTTHSRASGGKGRRQPKKPMTCVARLPKQAVATSGSVHGGVRTPPCTLHGQKSVKQSGVRIAPPSTTVKQINIYRCKRSFTEHGTTQGLTSNTPTEMPTQESGKPARAVKPPKPQKTTPAAAFAQAGPIPDAASKFAGVFTNSTLAGLAKQAAILIKLGMVKLAEEPYRMVGPHSPNDPAPTPGSDEARIQGVESEHYPKRTGYIPESMRGKINEDGSRKQPGQGRGQPAKAPAADPLDFTQGGGDTATGTYGGHGAPMQALGGGYQQQGYGYQQGGFGGYAMPMRPMGMGGFSGPQRRAYAYSGYGGYPQRGGWGGGYQQQSYGGYPQGGSWGSAPPNALQTLQTQKAKLDQAWAEGKIKDKAEWQRQTAILDGRIKDLTPELNLTPGQIDPKTGQPVPAPGTPPPPTAEEQEQVKGAQTMQGHLDTKRKGYDASIAKMNSPEYAAEQKAKFHEELKLDEDTYKNLMDENKANPLWEIKQTTPEEEKPSEPGPGRAWGYLATAASPLAAIGASKPVRDLAMEQSGLKKKFQPKSYYALSAAGQAALAKTGAKTFEEFRDVKVPAVQAKVTQAGFPPPGSPEHKAKVAQYETWKAELNSQGDQYAKANPYFAETQKFEKQKQDIQGKMDALRKKYNLKPTDQLPPEGVQLEQEMATIGQQQQKYNENPHAVVKATTATTTTGAPPGKGFLSGVTQAAKARAAQGAQGGTTGLPNINLDQTLKERTTPPTPADNIIKDVTTQSSGGTVPMEAPPPPPPPQAGPPPPPPQAGPPPPPPPLVGPPAPEPPKPVVTALPKPPTPPDGGIVSTAHMVRIMNPTTLDNLAAMAAQIFVKQAIMYSPYGPGSYPQGGPMTGPPGFYQNPYGMPPGQGGYGPPTQHPYPSGPNIAYQGGSAGWREGLQRAYDEAETKYRYSGNPADKQRAIEIHKRMTEPLAGTTTGEGDDAEDAARMKKRRELVRKAQSGDMASLLELKRMTAMEGAVNRALSGDEGGGAGGGRPGADERLSNRTAKMQARVKQLEDALRTGQGSQVNQDELNKLRQAMISGAGQTTRRSFHKAYVNPQTGETALDVPEAQAGAYSAGRGWEEVPMGTNWVLPSGSLAGTSEWGTFSGAAQQYASQAAKLHKWRQAKQTELDKAKQEADAAEKQYGGYEQKQVERDLDPMGGLGQFATPGGTTPGAPSAPPPMPTPPINAAPGGGTPPATGGPPGTVKGPGTTPKPGASYHGPATTVDNLALAAARVMVKSAISIADASHLTSKPDKEKEAQAYLAERALLKKESAGPMLKSIGKSLGTNLVGAPLAGAGIGGLLAGLFGKGDTTDDVLRGAGVGAFGGLGVGAGRMLARLPGGITGAVKGNLARRGLQGPAAEAAYLAASKPGDVTNWGGRVLGTLGGGLGTTMGLHDFGFAKIPPPEKLLASTPVPESEWESPGKGKDAPPGYAKPTGPEPWSPGREKTNAANLASRIATRVLQEKRADEYNDVPGALLGPVGGLMTAPSGRKLEGAGRGFVIGTGTALGSAGGNIAGQGLGWGLEALLRGMKGGKGGLRKAVLQMQDPLHPAIGQRLGGLGGIALGGYGGYKGTKDLMGQPGWEEKKAYTDDMGVLAGAMTAPEGHAGEGAGRGARTSLGQLGGSLLGGAGAGALGAGLGYGGHALINKFRGQGFQGKSGTGAILGALLGMGLGGSVGSIWGGERAKKSMGAPSWEKKPALGLPAPSPTPPPANLPPPPSAAPPPPPPTKQAGIGDLVGDTAAFGRDTVNMGGAGLGGLTGALGGGLLGAGAGSLYNLGKGGFKGATSTMGKNSKMGAILGALMGGGLGSMGGYRLGRDVTGTIPAVKNAMAMLPAMAAASAIGDKPKKKKSPVPDLGETPALGGEELDLNKMDTLMGELQTRKPRRRKKMI